MILEIVVETLAYFVVEALGYILSWRTWLCLIAMLAFACLLYAWGIWFIWPADIFVVAAILGIVLGVCWDQRVG